MPYKMSDLDIPNKTPNLVGVSVQQIFDKKNLNDLVNGIKSIKENLARLEDTVSSGNEQQHKDNEEAQDQSWDAFNDQWRYHNDDRASQRALRGSVDRGNKLAEIGLDLLRSGLKLITDSFKNSLRSIDTMVQELRKSRLSNEDIKKYSIATAQSLLNLSNAGYNVSRDTMNEYIKELVASGKNVDAMIREGTLDKYVMARFSGFSEELSRQAITLDSTTLKQLADASYDPALIATIKAVSESIDDSTRAAFNNDPKLLMDAIVKASKSMVSSVGNTMTAEQMTKNYIIPALKVYSGNYKAMESDEIGALVGVLGGKLPSSLDKLGDTVLNGIKSNSPSDLFVKSHADLTKGVMSAVLNTSQAANAGLSTGTRLKSTSQIRQAKADFSEKGLLQQKADETTAAIDVSTGVLSEMSVSINKYFGENMTMEQVVSGGFSMVIDLLNSVTGGIGNLLSGALSGILSGVITKAGGSFLAKLSTALGPVLAPIAAGVGIVAGVTGTIYGIHKLVQWRNSRNEERKIAENSKRQLEVAIKDQEEAQHNYEQALQTYGKDSTEVKNLEAILNETRDIAKKKKLEADQDELIAELGDKDAATFVKEDLQEILGRLETAKLNLAEAKAKGDEQAVYNLENDIGWLNQSFNDLAYQAQTANATSRRLSDLEAYRQERLKKGTDLDYSNVAINDSYAKQFSKVLSDEQSAILNERTRITHTGNYGITTSQEDVFGDSLETIRIQIERVAAQNKIYDAKINNPNSQNGEKHIITDKEATAIYETGEIISSLEKRIEQLNETDKETAEIYKKQIEELKKSNEQQKALRLEQEKLRLSNNTAALKNLGTRLQQSSVGGWFSSITNGLFDKLKNKPFENGGIVSSTTPAVIGEAGKEAVLPLTKPDNIRSILSNLTTSEKLLLLKSLINKKGNLSGDDIVNALAGITKSTGTSTVLEQSEFTDKVLEGARRQYGKKYSEIVCNQLVEAALKYAGFKTPTTGVVTKHFNNPKMHLVLNDPENGISPNNPALVPGMIMFSHPFTQDEADQLNSQKGGHRKAGDPGHMGIYAGNGLWWNSTSSKNTIDFSSGKGVKVTDSNKGFGVALTKPLSTGKYKLYAAGYYEGMFDNSIVKGLPSASPSVSAPSLKDTEIGTKPKVQDEAPLNDINNGSSLDAILESAKSAVSTAMSVIIATSNTETRQAVKDYVQQAMSLLNGKNTSEVISSLTVIVKYLKDIASSPANKRVIPSPSKPISSPF
jgi:hypothetical protein